jgi:anti-sigma regulatory factor (Ser/Thr protein kinase)
VTANFTRLAVTTMTLPDDPYVFALDLLPVQESCRCARRLAREALTSWGMDEAAIYNGVLVVNELVTNALAASTPSQTIFLRLFLGENGLPIVEVRDEVDDKPAIQEPNSDAEGGRGLFLVEKLCERWGTNPVAGGGKVVWGELPRTNREGLGRSW